MFRLIPGTIARLARGPVNHRPNYCAVSRVNATPLLIRSLSSNTATSPLRELTSEIGRVSGVELAKSWRIIRDKDDLELVDLHPTKHSLSNPMEIFANSEIDLDSIKVLGFDFDFTLVSYTNELQKLIYDRATEHLISKLRYPENFAPTFDKNFAIRGLMFDTKTGLMVKLNSSFNISLDCVFKGRRKLSKSEAFEAFQGAIHVTKEYRKEHLKGILDLFSLAEACLLCDVIQYLEDNNIPYSPASIFSDVNSAIAYVHTSGVMHNTVMQDVSRYVHKSTETRDILTKLRENGKKTFLLSNSSIEYIDVGMRYIAGDDWMTCFDVVITSSQKPSFYTSSKTFRMVDTGNIPSASSRGTPDNEEKYPLRWAEVKSLDQYKVYSGGNLEDLTKLTGWKGSEVLYIGDHVYTDLLEPARSQGWWTGAIIRELEHEIANERTLQHQAMNIRMQVLEEIMRRIQWASWDLDQLESMPKPDKDADCEVDSSWGLKRTLDYLEVERTKLRQRMNETHNINFGSVFRAQHASSLFAASLGNFVDLYTSRLANFSKYPMNYRFYPRKRGLPHEVAQRQNMVRDLLGSTMRRVIDAHELGLPQERDSADEIS